jgi:GT2 family glycosyltransferase
MSSAPSERVVVMMACFNRKNKTLHCIERLQQVDVPSNFRVDVWLLDDGSTDGTADAVTAIYPHVRVIRHPGGLYWNRAMHNLFKMVRDIEDPSYYVWLNDDTMLNVDALKKILSVAERGGGFNNPIIVVGATHDEVTGRVSYSGHQRISKWKTLKTRIMDPSDQVQHCDTFNGNCVLISKGAIKVVGLLDPVFEHGMGDLDYGLRASQKGVSLYLAPGFVGSCSRNATAGTFEDVSLPLHKRWAAIKSPKGLPPRSWLRFTFRHAGLMAPILFLWPYIKTIASAAKHRKIFE